MSHSSAPGGVLWCNSPDRRGYVCSRSTIPSRFPVLQGAPRTSSLQVCFSGYAVASQPPVISSPSAAPLSPRASFGASSSVSICSQATSISTAPSTSGQRCAWPKLSMDAAQTMRSPLPDGVKQEETVTVVTTSPSRQWSPDSSSPSKPSGRNDPNLDRLLNTSPLEFKIKRQERWKEIDDVQKQIEELHAQIAVQESALEAPSQAVEFSRSNSGGSDELQSQAFRRFETCQSTLSAVSHLGAIPEGCQMALGTEASSYTSTTTDGCSNAGSGGTSDFSDATFLNDDAGNSENKLDSETLAAVRACVAWLAKTGYAKNCSTADALPEEAQQVIRRTAQLVAMQTLQPDDVVSAALGNEILQALRGQELS